MTVLKILADYKIKAAKRREQETAFWRNLTGEEDVTIDGDISQKLNSIREDAEQNAYNLVLEFLDDPKRVKRKLLVADTATLTRIFLELNCEYPDVFVNPIRGRKPSAGFDYLHYLRESLLRVLTTNLELVKAKYQSRRSSYAAPDGYNYNPVYRSLYLQLKGLSRGLGEVLVAPTVTFPRKVWGDSFTKKVRTRIKNSLRRVLAELLGETKKYAVFSFECSADGTYHLHGLILLPVNKVEGLKVKLRQIAGSASNSVLVKDCPSRERLMSQYECRVNNAEWGKSTVKYRTEVTCGFADYISKDLGKRLGAGDIVSSIVTINPGRSSDVDYAAFNKARHEILSICAKHINSVLMILEPEELVSHLIEEDPLYQQLIVMMTNPRVLSKVA